MSKKRLIIAVIPAILTVIVFLVDPKIFFGIGRRGGTSLFVAISMIAAALGYGSVLLHRPEKRITSASIFLMIVTGLGIESFAMMILGFMGFVNLFVALAIIAGGLVPALKLLRENVHDIRIKENFELDFLSLSVICIGVFLLIYTLPVGLTPPVFYDGLVYHLALPKYYLLEGKIAIAPYNFHSFFPQSVEMLYLIALMAGGEIAPESLTWIFSALCLWGIAETAKKFGGKRAALWAALIAFGMPWLLICSQILYIEPIISVFMLGAFLLGASADEEWSSYDAAAAAIMAGSAMAAKYTAAPLAALIGIFTVVHLVKKKSWRQIAVYMTAGAIVASPWYFRNIIVAGNPVAPFYFGSKYWTIEQVANYAREHLAYGFATKPIYIKIFAPLLVFVTPQYFPQGLGGGIAPIFAAMLIPLAKSRYKLLWPIAIFIFGALIWTFTSQQGRFMLVPEIFLVIAGAVALAEIENNIVVRRMAIAVLLVASLSSMIDGLGSVALAFRPWKGILSRQSVDDYIDERTESYRPIRKVAEPGAGLPSDGVVLFVGETRTYYMNRPFIPISAWDLNPLVKAVSECEDTSCIKNKLGELNIKIIIRNTKEEKRLSEYSRTMRILSPAKMELYNKFLNESTLYGSGKDFFVYLL